MKFLYIILLFANLLLSQDRSVIFNTGSPDSLTSGYSINSNHSIANRITVSNNYVLEAMVFYMTTEQNNAMVKVSIREDNDGIPGELVSEFSEWNHTVEPLNLTGYNLIVTTNQCIYLETGNYYWWTIEAADESTNVIWVYSNGAFYNTASTENSGEIWNTQLSAAGAGAVYAEQIYQEDVIQGDLNFDFVINVIDVVSMINGILEGSFTPEQLAIGDMNSDGIVNVIDAVALVNLIIIPLEQNPDFSLEDINPASEYYGIDIGRSFFSGQVSCYYFGKQG